MATRTIANGGGNWTAGATWVEGVAPTSSDNVVATATSGNLVVNSTTLCICASADFTGYTGILSGTGNIQLFGNITLVTGMTITVTGSIAPNASGTWTSNGKIWNGGIVPTAVSTITLADDWTIVGAFGHTTTGGTITFNNNNLFLRGNYTASSGRIITGSSLVVLNATTTQTINVSGTWSIDMSINASGAVIIQGLNVSASMSITYVTAGSFSHTGLLSVLSSFTFDTAGISWNNVTITSNSTMTLNSLWSIAGTLTITTVSVVFDGTAAWTCSTFTITTGNQTLQSGNTYTINTAINVAGTSANTGVLQSSSGVSTAALTLVQGASQDVDFLDTIRIDASAGKTIWTYRGTPTSSVNVKLMPVQPATMSSGN